MEATRGACARTAHRRAKLKESRKYPRYQPRLRCWCEADDVTVYARIANLGEGGLFLRTNTPLREGAKAHVRFGDGPAHEVAADVRVVWTSDGAGKAPPGMGLQFESLDEKSLEQLRRIIMSEQQQPARPVG